MGNDQAHGADRIGVGVGAPLGESGHGTTHWRIERWNEGQTRDAYNRLKGLGIVVPIENRDFRANATITPGLFRRVGVAPYEVSEFTGNLITNAGWTRLMNLLTAQGATQAFDATHTRIGVGNATTPAEAYADTDLAAAAGSANRWFQLVTAAGTLGTRTLTWTATFGTADGNFAWNEFGIDAGTASGNTVTAPLLNHKVAIAQGTKVSGQTWTATATLTFT